MKLNPLKCEELLINFMKYPNNIIHPICTLFDDYIFMVKPPNDYIP